MAADRVKIEGTRELRASLDKAGAELADLRALNAKIGDALAVAGRPRAPVLMGNLAASIRSSGTKTAGVVRAGGGSVPYAGVQEFGWPARGIPAQPYLTAALIEVEPKVLALYHAELERILANVHGAPGFGR